MTVAEVKHELQSKPRNIVLVDCRNPEEQDVRRGP